jgi:crooked neck
MKATDNGNTPQRIEVSRKVYWRAYDCMKANGSKEERVVLLDAILSFEENNGTEESVNNVKNRMPKSVKKRRRLTDEQGGSAGWEEYYDYIFPDDEEEKPNLKLLEMAHRWKQQMAEASSKND